MKSPKHAIEGRDARMVGNKGKKAAKKAEVALVSQEGPAGATPDATSSSARCSSTPKLSGNSGTGCNFPSCRRKRCPLCSTSFCAVDHRAQVLKEDAEREGRRGMFMVELCEAA